MKARAECKLENGETDLVVEIKASTFASAMDGLRVAVLNEFDHSFEANKWASVKIEIIR